MNGNVVETDIQNSFAAVLENWALLMIEPVEGDPPFNPDEPLLVSRIQFRGVVNGEYQIVCQTPFADTLASNLLGAEGDGSTETRIDALREMANVLAGNLLTKSFGEDTVFDLSSAQVTEEVSKDPRELLRGSPFFLMADDQPIGLSMVLET